MLVATPPPNFVLVAELVESVPWRLTEARTRLALSPADAAVQIGIGKATLLRVEAGTSDPTMHTVTACLRWLARSSLV